MLGVVANATIGQDEVLAGEALGLGSHQESGEGRELSEHLYDVVADSKSEERGWSDCALCVG